MLGPTSNGYLEGDSEVRGAASRSRAKHLEAGSSLASVPRLLERWGEDPSVDCFLEQDIAVLQATSSAKEVWLGPELQT